MGVGAGWAPQGGGIIAPVQAKAVVITVSESYAIHETVEEIKDRLNQLGGEIEKGDHIFITVHPKEGGTALLNLKHIVGFVSFEDEATAG